MKSLKLKITTLVSMLITAFAVSANDYSEVYVFGDSLSDTGNLEQLQNTAPARFSNGLVAVEVVADAYGINITNSRHLLGQTFGNNFAIAGAKAIDEDGDESTPDINLPTQVNAFLQRVAGVAPSDALYIVMIGGNDIRAAREARSAAVFAATPEERQAARQAANDILKAAVESEQAQIEKLIAAGATNIIVGNAPDIGAIPETDLIAAGLAANATTNQQLRKANRLPEVSTKLTAKYNRKLARKLARIEHQTGVDLIEYDLFSFMADQIENAEDYSYSNTDEPCLYALTGQGVHPDCFAFPSSSGFFFWDEIHPTTEVQQRAGAEIVDILQSL